MDKLLKIITDVNSSVNNFIWGVPSMICIVGVGLWLLIRNRGVQFTKFGYAFKHTFGKIFNKKETSDGAISPFQAVCTALAGTVGTGNIAGVAGAIAIGGPGAVFWMWISALLGMGTKFAEVVLAVFYREKDSNGDWVGGPMYYIKNGLGKNAYFLAIAYSVLGILTVFGTGNATQVNTITTAIDSALFNYNLADRSNTFTINLVIGIIIAILVALILIGGIKRIGSVTEKLVPFMAAMYIIMAVVLVFINIKSVPGVFASIFEGAFNPKSVTGGVVGSLFLSMRKGVSRGIFSNEAGLGTGSIAHACSDVKHPVQQGLWGIFEVFIDTIVICTLTGLSIVLTGAWQVDGLEGVQVTTYAFQNGLPLPKELSAFVLMLCLVFFAFTTILGWDYYSERCLEYLSGGRMKYVKVYRWIYILAVFIGPYMTVSAVWTIADIFNGLMALPNMIALFALSGVVVKETRHFFERHRNGEIED